MTEFRKSSVWSVFQKSLRRHKAVYFGVFAFLIGLNLLFVNIGGGSQLDAPPAGAAFEGAGSNSDVYRYGLNAVVKIVRGGPSMRDILVTYHNDVAAAFPQYVPPVTALGNNSLVQDYIVGLTRGQLADDTIRFKADFNSMDMVEKANLILGVKWTGQPMAYQELLPLGKGQVIKIDENLSNFRYNADGTVYKWIDPIFVADESNRQVAITKGITLPPPGTTTQVVPADFEAQKTLGDALPESTKIHNQFVSRASLAIKPVAADLAGLGKHAVASDFQRALVADPVVLQLHNQFLITLKSELAVQGFTTTLIPDSAKSTAYLTIDSGVGLFGRAAGNIKAYYQLNFAIDEISTFAANRAATYANYSVPNIVKVSFDDLSLIKNKDLATVPANMIHELGNRATEIMRNANTPSSLYAEIYGSNVSGYEYIVRSNQMENFANELFQKGRQLANILYGYPSNLPAVQTAKDVNRSATFLNQMSNEHLMMVADIRNNMNAVRITLNSAGEYTAELGSPDRQRYYRIPVVDALNAVDAKAKLPAVLDEVVARALNAKDVVAKTLNLPNMDKRAAQLAEANLLARIGTLPAYPKVSAAKLSEQNRRITNPLDSLTGQPTNLTASEIDSLGPKNPQSLTNFNLQVAKNAAAEAAVANQRLGDLLPQSKMIAEELAQKYLVVPSQAYSGTIYEKIQRASKELDARLYVGPHEAGFAAARVLADQLRADISRFNSTFQTELAANGFGSRILSKGGLNESVVITSVGTTSTTPFAKMLRGLADKGYGEFGTRIGISILQPFTQGVYVNREQVGFQRPIDPFRLADGTSKLGSSIFDISLNLKSIPTSLTGLHEMAVHGGTARSLVLGNTTPYQFAITEPVLTRFGAPQNPYDRFIGGDEARAWRFELFAEGHVNNFATGNRIRSVYRFSEEAKIFADRAAKLTTAEIMKGLKAITDVPGAAGSVVELLSGKVYLSDLPYSAAIDPVTVTQRFREQTRLIYETAIDNQARVVEQGALHARYSGYVQSAGITAELSAVAAASRAAYTNLALTPKASVAGAATLPANYVKTILRNNNVDISPETFKVASGDGESASRLIVPSDRSPVSQAMRADLERAAGGTLSNELTGRNVTLLNTPVTKDLGFIVIGVTAKDTVEFYDAYKAATTTAAQNQALSDYGVKVLNTTLGGMVFQAVAQRLPAAVGAATEFLTLNSSAAAMMGRFAQYLVTRGAAGMVLATEYNLIVYAMNRSGATQAIYYDRADLVQNWLAEKFGRFNKYIFAFDDALSKAANFFLGTPGTLQPPPVVVPPGGTGSGSTGGSPFVIGGTAQGTPTPVPTIAPPPTGSGGSPFVIGGTAPGTTTPGTTSGTPAAGTILQELTGYWFTADGGVTSYWIPSENFTPEMKAAFVKYIQKTRGSNVQVAFKVGPKPDVSLAPKNVKPIILDFHSTSVASTDPRIINLNRVIVLGWTTADYSLATTRELAAVSSDPANASQHLTAAKSYSAQASSSGNDLMNGLADVNTGPATTPATGFVKVRFGFQDLQDTKTLAGAQSSEVFWGPSRLVLATKLGLLASNDNTEFGAIDYSLKNAKFDGDDLVTVQELASSTSDAAIDNNAGLASSQLVAAPGTNQGLLYGSNLDANAAVVASNNSAAARAYNPTFFEQLGISSAVNAILNGGHLKEAVKSAVVGTAQTAAAAAVLTKLDSLIGGGTILGDAVGFAGTVLEVLKGNLEGAAVAVISQMAANAILNQVGFALAGPIGQIIAGVLGGLLGGLIGGIFGGSPPPPPNWIVALNTTPKEMGAVLLSGSGFKFSYLRTARSISFGSNVGALMQPIPYLDAIYTGIDGKAIAVGWSGLSSYDYSSAELQKVLNSAGLNQLSQAKGYGSDVDMFSQVQNPINLGSSPVLRSLAFDSLCDAGSWRICKFNYNLRQAQIRIPASEQVNTCVGGLVDQGCVNPRALVCPPLASLGDPRCVPRGGPAFVYANPEVVTRAPAFAPDKSALTFYQASKNPCNFGGKIVPSGGTLLAHTSYSCASTAVNLVCNDGLISSTWTGPLDSLWMRCE